MIDRNCEAFVCPSNVDFIEWVNNLKERICQLENREALEYDYTASDNTISQASVVAVTELAVFEHTNESVRD